MLLNESTAGGCFFQLLYFVLNNMLKFMSHIWKEELNFVGIIVANLFDERIRPLK